MIERYHQPDIVNAPSFNGLDLPYTRLMIRIRVEWVSILCVTFSFIILFFLIEKLIIFTN